MIFEYIGWLLGGILRMFCGALSLGRVLVFWRARGVLFEGWLELFCCLFLGGEQYDLERRVIHVQLPTNIGLSPYFQGGGGGMDGGRVALDGFESVDAFWTQVETGKLPWMSGLFDAFPMFSYEIL